VFGLATVPIVTVSPARVGTSSRTGTASLCKEILVVVQQNAQAHGSLKLTAKCCQLGRELKLTRAKTNAARGAAFLRNLKKQSA
jgi:hypothetical protein